MEERQFLRGVKYEGKWSYKVVSGSELIYFIDMMDCDPDIEDYMIYELCEDGKMQKIYYRGWQPGCLIEFVNDKGEVILDGYGTDH
jgi:hypothetical protein